MTLAHLNNGIVASNNLSDVEEYIESLDIELITSSMILSKAVENDIVSENTANILERNGRRRYLFTKRFFHGLL